MTRTGSTRRCTSIVIAPSIGPLCRTAFRDSPRCPDSALTAHRVDPHLGCYPALLDKAHRSPSSAAYVDHDVEGVIPKQRTAEVDVDVERRGPELLPDKRREKAHAATAADDRCAVTRAPGRIQIEVDGVGGVAPIAL